MSVLGKVIAGVVLAPIVIIVIGIGGCEARKAYYDWRVREMCDRDGGVTVLERKRLSASEAQTLGTVGGFLSIPTKDLANPGSPVYAEDHRTELRASNPEIYRVEERLVWRESAQVFARVVRYTRRGGDFPFFAHPSYFMCPSDVTIFQERERAFEIEGRTP